MMMYEVWSYFVADEVNAWWLMMVVFTATCITFIYNNSKIRQSLYYLRSQMDRWNVILDEVEEDNDYTCCDITFRAKNKKNLEEWECPSCETAYEKRQESRIYTKTAEGLLRKFLK